MRHLPWLSASVAIAGAVVAILPAGAEALQYDRVRVASGGVWLLLTGQFAHWSPRMATLDLGAVLLLGGLLEIRNARRLAALALALGALATAAAVQLLPPYFDTYRGASGLASALYVAVAIEIGWKEAGWRRLLAIAALAGFVGKVAWEARTGQPFAAGTLPPGVAVASAVHVIAGLAGAAAAGFRKCPPPSP